nr:hypothetical protein [Halovivax sp.]
MRERDVERLPVRGGTKPLGIVTLADVGRHPPDRLGEGRGLSTRVRGGGEHDG